MPEVVFLKVDVDENPETAAKYSVSAMPTFLFIKGGEIVDRLMGANPDRLREMIEELMWAHNKKRRGVQERSTMNFRKLQFVNRGNKTTAITVLVS